MASGDAISLRLKARGILVTPGSSCTLDGLFTHMSLATNRLAPGKPGTVGFRECRRASRMADMGSVLAPCPTAILGWKADCQLSDGRQRKRPFAGCCKR